MLTGPVLFDVREDVDEVELSTYGGGRKGGQLELTIHLTSVRSLPSPSSTRCISHRSIVTLYRSFTTHDVRRSILLPHGYRHDERLEGEGATVDGQRLKRMLAFASRLALEPTTTSSVATSRVLSVGHVSVQGKGRMGQRLGDRLSSRPSPACSRQPSATLRPVSSRPRVSEDNTTKECMYDGLRTLRY